MRPTGASVDRRVKTSEAHDLLADVFLNSESLRRSKL